MPALYRMPITYVALLVVVVAYLAVGLRSGGSSVPSTTDAVEVDSPSAVPIAHSDVTPNTQSAKPNPLDDAILRTADGLRRKVIVTALDVVPQAKPGGSQRTGSPLDYLAIRYVFGESPTSFEVGDSKGRLGWVSRNSVLEWDTRLMARPTPRSGRPPIVIFEQEECRAASVSGRNCLRHAGKCPTVGEESAESADASNSVLGWPILRTKTLGGTAGAQRIDLLEVAPLVNDRPPAPTEPPADLRPALQTVYVAFVVDTTASMQSTIDSVREVARLLTERTGMDYRDVTLRLGLVAYRDKSPSFEYVAKRVVNFTSPSIFQAALKTLEAAPKGDGSVDEAVFEGVALALPGDARHLTWPTGREADLSTKVLVLLGDAPDHAKDLAMAKSLAAQANREQITIASVSLKSPTALSRDEAARYENQWRTLAEESYLPADRRQGFAKPIPPQRLALDQVGGLSTTLVTLIDARIERARTLAALAAAEAEGRLAEYVDSQGLTPKQVAPVLVDLHKGEARPNSRPDLRFEGKKAPTLRQGWIARRLDNADLVTLEMLLSRDELDTLIGEFSALQQAARGSADDLGKLLEAGTAAASGETSFLSQDRGKQTFADHLKRRQGVAPAGSNSVLNLSRTDLMRSGSVERKELDRRLGEGLRKLVQRRSARDWSQPGKTIEGRALVPFAWIDF